MLWLRVNNSNSRINYIKNMILFNQYKEPVMVSSEKNIFKFLERNVKFKKTKPVYTLEEYLRIHGYSIAPKFDRKMLYNK